MTWLSVLIAIGCGVAGGAFGAWLMRRATYERGFRAGQRDAQRTQPELFYQDTDGTVRTLQPRPHFPPAPHAPPRPRDSSRGAP